MYGLAALFTSPSPPSFFNTESLSAFADPEPRIRMLGLTVVRGPTITLLSPVDGLEEISNPFIAQE